jgi:hypothetical protein
MQCNIDAKGKSVRLLTGLAMLAIAAVVAALAYFEVLPRWTLWAAAGLAVAGGFGVFEARAGWCVVRAMGFRTPV